MIPWGLLLNKHVLMYGGLIIALGIAVYWIHNKGYEECKNEILVKTVEVIKERDKLEREVIGLPKPDLVSRACEWVRDSSKSECIEAYLSE